MVKLNKIVTESISGISVLVSYDDKTQKFTVVDKETEEVLSTGEEIHVCNFLELNGARIFAPRFMANYPIEKMNANNADMSHMSPFSLLEFLRLRKGVDGPIELTIYPRDMQEGSKFVEGIKIPLGECLVNDIKKASLINLMLTMKESMNNIKKIAVRTFNECDDRQIAFATEDGKYFPMVISPKDEDSFVNSIVLIFGNGGVDIDEEKLKTAFDTPHALSVISKDPCVEEEEDTITECFSVDDLINSHIVVFESSDLNALSNTMFHVHPEATARKWKVSEIKENVNKNVFYFEVQGNKTDDLLSDDFVMGRLLSENVYITHRTPMHESSPVDKAVFALMNGMDIKEAINSMVEEHNRLQKTNKSMQECGLGALANAPVSTGCDCEGACTCGHGTISSDIHGIAGRVLAPMIKKKDNKKKTKDVVKVNDGIRSAILREMGIEDQYNDIMSIKQGLKEDDEPALNLDMGSGSDDSSNSFNFDLGNSGSSDNSSSGLLGDSMPPEDNSESENSGEENKNDRPEIDPEVAVVTDSVEDDSSLVEVKYTDGTISQEPLNNLVVSSSVKVPSDETGM